MHSHKGGQSFIDEYHGEELEDVCNAIAAVDAVKCLAKRSKEKTKPALLFHPETLNLLIKKHLHPLGWTKVAPTSRKGFKEPRIAFGGGSFREMDGIKNKVGVEIQFGKYAFMGYDIFSKMVIFKNHGLIECGIEVVAMPDVVKQMSTGVSSFNQILLDMRERGEADIDIPTLVIGIGLTDDEEEGCEDKRHRFASNPDALLASGEVSKGRKGASPGPKGEKELYLEDDLDEEVEAEVQEEKEEEDQA